MYQYVMRSRLGGFLVFVGFALAGCASSRPAASGGSVSDYNSYNDDLSLTRPVYAPMPASTSTAPAPRVSTPPAVIPVSPRKPETRKTNGPVEALHVNRKLDSVLDTIATKNRSIRYAPGYRVQVYVGNQRQEVDAAKLLIYQKFPELSPYLSYSQPTYKLKVGDFMRRIDAEHYYASIRQLIPSAQLQPDKVDIRRSLLIK